ncbi:MAG: glycosyltransferase [Actinomycetota bacterium]
MRIGYLSSFPPIECGIATYTSYLEEATARLDIDTFVVAPHGAQGDNVFPTYQAGSGGFAPAAYQMFTQLTPDVVHIQHEYGLFGPSRGVEVVDLVLRLRLVDIPVVVTLHTVYESLKPGEQLVLRHLLPECQGIIVHEDFQRSTLRRELGDEVADKVTVLDHGVREVMPVRDPKRKLGLHPADKVVMMCGYFRPTKGFHKAVEFFGEVAEAHPDAVLVMAGKTRNIEYDDYRQELLAEIAETPFASRVQVLAGQFPQHTFDTLLSAADVVVLPYDVGAQSGVLSQAIAFKRPLVTSQLKAFTSVTRRSGAGVSCPDSELGAQINRVLGSRAVANSFSAAADTYIRRRAGWSVIARRHEELYRSLMADRIGAGARHVHVSGETERVLDVAGQATGNGNGSNGNGSNGNGHRHSTRPLAIGDWLKTAENFDPPAPVAAEALAE